MDYLKQKQFSLAAGFGEASTGIMLESALRKLSSMLQPFLYLTIAKLSARDFLLFSEKAEKKLSFVELLERLLLPLVGILFTVQGFTHLYSSLSSSPFAFLLMADNPKITYPFIFFVTYTYQWGPKFMTFLCILRAGASFALQIPYI